MSDLQSVNLISGVNDAGEPFVAVAAVSTTGQIHVGQLDPPQVRAMALAWLAVAEAAEQDAATLRIIRKLELPDELAARVVVELRDSRR